MKKKSKKYRNPAAIPAKKRKAGAMKNKKKKRNNGCNEQLELINNENF